MSTQGVPEDGAPARIETCSFCTETYEVPEVPEGYEAHCTWCGESLPDQKELEWKVSVSHKFALLGLVLIPFAFSLTMLSVEQFGTRTDAGLVQGVVTLFRHGEYFLAAVIGLLSGLFPCLKLLGIVILTSRRFVRVRHSRWIHSFVEFTSKWSMIDVFLAAVMIFGFKFSSMFSISPQAGIVAFSAMVLCNIISTRYFDTRIFRRAYNVGNY